MTAPDPIAPGRTAPRPSRTGGLIPMFLLLVVAVALVGAALGELLGVVDAF